MAEGNRLIDKKKKGSDEMVKTLQRESISEREAVDKTANKKRR